MAIIEFDESAARAWMTKAEDLNNRTELCMRSVAAALETLKTNSVGDMVDEVALTGAQVLEATNGLVTAMSGIVSSISSIIGALAQAVMEGVASAIAGRAKGTQF